MHKCSNGVAEREANLASKYGGPHRASKHGGANRESEYTAQQESDEGADGSGRSNVCAYEGAHGFADFIAFVKAISEPVSSAERGADCETLGLAFDKAKRGANNEPQQRADIAANNEPVHAVPRADRESQHDSKCKPYHILCGGRKRPRSRGGIRW